ncbi:MAG: hypothetical protein RLZZ401_189, partial [Pseudomonadota bacterium]
MGGPSRSGLSSAADVLLRRLS